MSSKDHILGLDAKITRRDFVNGSIATASAATLASCRGPGPTAESSLEPSGSAWTGYGGVGDYRWSNGNTEAVRDAAHRIRDRQLADLGRATASETYDVIVVGGGFSGLSAAYEFHKGHRSGERLLLLDNHPMVGGEAKQNEIEVNGHRLVGPQGSNAGLLPTSDLIGTRYATYAEYYHELGLPPSYPLQAVAGGAERLDLPTEHFLPMVNEQKYPVGYFFRGHGWVKNPQAAHFTNTPWPANVQHDLDDFAQNRRDLISAQPDGDRWLDSMTYRQLLDQLGYGPEVFKYIDPFIAVGNYGVSGDAISAYAAQRLGLPGTIPSGTPSRLSDVKVVSFPGGNAGFYRAMLRRIIPNSITGPTSIVGSLNGKLNFAALDQPGQPVRIRLSATAVEIKHDGDPDRAQLVSVTYLKDGQLHRATAKSVVMAGGGWVNRRVLADLPDAHRAAYSQFNYGPVLTANVALTNWRFFERLGISVARWFEGLGWHVIARRNIAFGQSEPLSPDSPIMLTFYIPFLFPGQGNAAAQGSLARQHLLSTSYLDFERQIREQMSELFGEAGFDARRDIAGIVLNRWGHAYLAPGPGFFFGRNGELPPHEIIRRGYGRIQFGHSELNVNMNMAHAMMEGKRAGLAAIEAART